MLALSKAQAYCEHVSCSLGAYLDLLLARETELLSEPQRPEGYDVPIAAAWDIAFETIQETKGAADLLNHLAYVAPKAFPRDILVEHDDVRLWPVYGHLLAHDTVSAGHAEHLGVEPEQTGRHLNQIAQYLTSRAAFGEALPLHKRALSILEAKLSPDYPNTETCSKNYEICLRDAGGLGCRSVCCYG